MRDKIKQIINHFGITNQLKKLNEECYELIEAIRNYEYQKEACENIGCSKIHADKEYEHIEEEIADVYVLLNQIKEYYDLNEAQIIINEHDKINRTIERIESGYYK